MHLSADAAFLPGVASKDRKIDVDRKAHLDALESDSMVVELAPRLTTEFALHSGQELHSCARELGVDTADTGWIVADGQCVAAAVVGGAMRARDSIDCGRQC